MTITELFEQIIQLPREEQDSLVAMLHDHQATHIRPFDERLEDPTPAEILEDIRLSLLDVAAGRTRPAHEALDEIERELGLK